jgi:hypothetical protein
VDHTISTLRDRKSESGADCFGLRDRLGVRSDFISIVREEIPAKGNISAENYRMYLLSWLGGLTASMGKAMAENSVSNIRWKSGKKETTKETRRTFARRLIRIHFLQGNAFQNKYEVSYEM